ncbi:DUF1810 domain-containing protein [Paracraurococcus ruber]|uniref:Calpastatin n=1 Tax=Paracraurococcus ruber TaxID=77675 RepID=A0ABS1D355_9PROT|nr:DUF1810 domain-containing protein [Paracraurococcus ruber]MBK1661275.1 calpastatin [Paracraurococcus ruber]TDG23901.1 DUF1810 domain-containing protein [Paracraurococcus ruber]
MQDPPDLQRFVAAQDPVIDQVRRELAAGRKASHWMWFVFPQLRGLGQSAMAQRYGLASLAEARAYLDHPVLGPRMAECTALLNAAPGTGAATILGSVDARKLRSCLTLMLAARPGAEPYRTALRRFFGDAADPATLALLAAED